MRVQWHKIVLWLILEITLTFLGFDDLADYSEFIFDQQATIIRNHIVESNYYTKSYCKKHLLEIQQNPVETLQATSLHMQRLYKRGYMNRI